VLEVSLIPSSITAHTPRYIHKGNEVIVGFQTDAPLTRDHAERRLANGAEFSENLWLSGVPLGGGRVHQVSHALHRRPDSVQDRRQKKSL